MPIEPKEIVEYIGIDLEKFDSIDEAKKEFDSKFKTLDSIKSDPSIRNELFGRKVGELETVFKRTAREAGVSFDDNEISGKKFEELIPLAFEKLNSSYSSQIEELKANSNSGTDERIKTLSETLEKQKKEYSQLQNLMKTSIDGLQNEKHELESSMKNYKLDIHKNQVMSQLKLKSQITEIEKKGFDALINENLNFDFDESGSIFVSDKKGNKIPNPNKAGEFMAPLDALSELAKKAGVVEVNPHANRQTASTVHLHGSPTAEAPRREVSAAYRKRVNGQ